MGFIVEARNLTKVYEGGVLAVDRISFEVEEGEVFGFLGPNGAGKTTTIKMLVTLLKPTEGEAKVCGYDVVRKAHEVRKSIGIVFQDPALDTELTGRENLDYHARLYGMSSDTRKRRIEEVLELVELTDRADDLVKKYSGGMRRRLEIARGLMHYPKVLFLDEPTLGLDAQTRRAIWRYIRRLNEEEGMTIFLTTHYIEEADELCDRVAIIDHGRIIALDRPSNLKDVVGRDVIYVKSSDDPKLAEALKSENWVNKVKVGEELAVYTSSSEKRIPLIFKVAQEVGVEIESINMKKPSLEDVYIYYTGRKMRDEEAGPVDHIRMLRRRRLS
jgi:ABC-2 type transport system ATP-binding protein